MPELENLFHCALCYRCGDSFDTDDSTPLAIAVDEQQSRGYCNQCAEQLYFSCSNCGEVAYLDYSNQVSTGRICEDCYTAQFRHCSSCGTSVPIDSLVYQVYCRNCADNTSIFPYHAKPTFELLGEGKHHYGLELEAEYRGHDAGRLDSIARRTRKLFPRDFCIIKEDSSVGCGFEICTRPATIEKQKESWSKFFTDRSRSLRSYNTGTCGLHVHVSRKNLTLLQIGKMCLFVTHPQNRDLTSFIAQRDSHWGNFRKCKKLTELHPYRCNGSHCPHGADKYDAVNLTHRESIEFRIFKGTLKDTSFFKSLDFVSALVAFTSPANQSCQDLSTPQFKKFVYANEKDFPHLGEYLRKGQTERTDD